MASNQQKTDNYVIMASIKSEPTCELINRIPGLCILISSLPGKALRILLNRKDCLTIQTCLVKLPWVSLWFMIVVFPDHPTYLFHIKRREPGIFYL